MTVLLDPARIKRGLVEQPSSRVTRWRSVARIRLVVDGEVRDARGPGCGHRAEREYLIVEDERRRVEPADWVLAAPRVGDHRSVEVAFDRPLDHALLARCLRVTGPDGRGIGGTIGLGPQERSWRFTPTRAWAPGRHRLEVDPIVEDLAGNSVARVFDRDLGQAADEPRAGGHRGAGRSSRSGR